MSTKPTARDGWFTIFRIISLHFLLRVVFVWDIHIFVTAALYFVLLFIAAFFYYMVIGAYEVK